MVLHDKSNGIIISGSSLVLQGVTRKHGGKYSCVASNIEGDTQSNILSLKVMCKFQKNQSKISQYVLCILHSFSYVFSGLTDKPICSNLHRVVQGVGRDRVAEIVCPVNAHPPPTEYSWTFNSSLETHSVSSQWLSTSL